MKLQVPKDDNVPVPAEAAAQTLLKEQLDEVLPEVIKKKSDHSLLEKTGSWGDVAQSVLRMVREENA